MKYKKYLNGGFALIFASLTLVSCSKDDETGENTRNQKPVGTLDRTNVTAAEGDDVTFTLTFDKASSTPMDFKLDLINDESTSNLDDFTVPEGELLTDLGGGGYGQGPVGYQIVVPAYATSYTFTIKPTVDLLPESTETMKFSLRSSGNGLGLIADSSKNITISVANTISDDFFLRLEWAGSYTDVNGDTDELCDFDFDLEVYDSSFIIAQADVDGDGVPDDLVSYSGCPEEVTIPVTAADGDYFIVPSFYSNTVPAAQTPAADIQYPVKLTLAKPGAFNYVVDMSDKFTYNVGGAEQGNPDAYVPVAIVTKLGNTYTVKDYNDPSVILAQGRMAGMHLQHKKPLKK